MLSIPRKLLPVGVWIRPLAAPYKVCSNGNMDTRDAVKRTLTGQSLRRSLIVTVIVGTALNFINQGTEILAGGWPVLWKIGLTYAVPFVVASYGSYAAFKSSP